MRRFTTFMPRRDWRRKQDFVLDQGEHVKIGLRLEGIELVDLEFFVRDRRPRLDQTQDRQLLQTPLVSSETTLATEMQDPAKLEPQVAISAGGPLPGETPSHLAVLIEQDFVQPAKLDDGNLSRQRPAFVGELEGILDYTSLRHKPGMILFPPCRVKAPLQMPMKLVLASTSTYRRALLERLLLPFETVRPETDETPFAGEAPSATAARLARAKARAVSDSFPEALIIGSDQVAYLGSEVFGKPGNAERAIEQLRRMRGRTVIFDTAVALINTRSGREQQENVLTEVKFRELTDQEIVRYVDKEQPFDCAGSAKSEALGITLLDALSGDDPTALVGLPLIALSRMLRAEGIALP